MDKQQMDLASEVSDARPRHARDARGASAVEYGLLIAGIAATIILVVFAFGGRVADIFTDTCNSIAAGSNGANC